MIRYLCGLLNHPILTVMVPDGLKRVFCVCGLTDFFAPRDF